MLAEERIRDAESNVRSYISDGLISRTNFSKLVFDTYIRNHRESLNVADMLYNDGLSDLWVVVTSYYSMFYIGNAVLYDMGYKVGHRIAHKVTSDALVAFVRCVLKDMLIESFEEEQDEALAISDSMMENFEYERTKRSRFQYETTQEIKHAKARTSLERAKLFSLELEKILC